MNYNNPIPKKTVGIIRYSCGLLFSAFCFCFLFFLRGDVLAEVQYHLSGGLTTYSVLVGALIITFLLQLLQWVVKLLLHLPEKLYFLTYVPSFIFLSMLIDIDQNKDGGLVWGAWSWLLPLLLFSWLIAVFVVKRVSAGFEESTQTTVQANIWPNYLGLMVLICLCGFVSKTPTVKQYEMKVERLLNERDYAEAAAVGIQSQETSQRLTQLRMYALSKQGLLADSLFSYPHIYGTKGLIDIHDTTTANRFPMQNIELYLGAFAGRSIRSDKRFLEILSSDSLASEQSKQYMLCYHLLDKNLKDFDKVLHQVYGDTIEAELPRAYQEAVIMQHEYTPDSLPIYINKVYVERYAGYNAMRDSLSDATERKNRTRREYGNSYWWYFDN